MLNIYLYTVLFLVVSLLRTLYYYCYLFSGIFSIFSARNSILWLFLCLPSASHSCIKSAVEESHTGSNN